MPEEQDFDQESLLRRQEDETPPDLEATFGEAHQGADEIRRQIDDDMQMALNLGERLGEQAGPVVEQMNRLKGEVDEMDAAFEARTERLNSPYVLSPDLEKVLRVSRVLEKPLILEGEPGTGKTSLAYALAGHEDLPIIHAQCKSTTTAKDLLYQFDVVKRLQDAQLGKDVSDLSQYVHLGPLGRAFASEEQVILLIDEVDKAKRDFSNDLLHELDQMAFFVDETGEEVAARHRPVVIITSNHERDLPEPVLRRSVYHYIDFPPAEQMGEIVRAHIPDVNAKLLESATRKFYEIRDTEGLQKKPSTSEMLDWIRVLQEFGIEEVGEDIPYPETLLKYKEDSDRVIGARQERLRQAQMPESVIAALRGDTVVNLKMGNSNYSPDKAIYSMLANSGIPFDTHKGDYRTEREFDIKMKGVHKVGPLDFSFEPGTDAMGLLDRFDEGELLSSVYEVSDQPIEFAEIEEANELFVRGRDSQDREVFRTTDGKVVVEKKISYNPEIEEGPFAGSGLREKQVQGLTEQGIQSTEDLVNMLRNKGEDAVLELPGVGRRVLANLKRIERGDTSEPEDDEDESLLGSSTLSKLRRGGLKFDDEDENE